MTFAKGTTVPVEKSQAEIKKVITSAGAVEFVLAEKHSGAAITFRMHERWIRFELAFPDREELRFWQTNRGGVISKHGGKVGYFKTEQQSAIVYDAEIRRLWRALLLVLKAKLESAKSGIATFETEFLAHIVMPDGMTVGQHVTPAIAEAYSTNRMPRLLPAPGDR